MAKLIAVANMKGGVGKTATVVGLAETLAANAIDDAIKDDTTPKSVLVVDLDAQASASFALSGEDRLMFLIDNRQTIDGFLERYLIKGQEVALSSLVSSRISDVSHRNETLPIGLLAASPQLRTVERNLIYWLTRRGYSLERVEGDLFHLLAGQIQEVSRGFDYVIFDCPPGISILTEIALRQSHLIIVPTIPDFLSILALDAFTRHVSKRRADEALGHPAPKSQPHVLITLRQPIPEHDQRVAELRKRTEVGRAVYKVMGSEIPWTKGVPEALERVDPSLNYAQKWSAQLRSHFADVAAEMKAAVAATP
jgi:chromosome partitioning protein